MVTATIIEQPTVGEACTELVGIGIPFEVRYQGRKPYIHITCPWDSAFRCWKELLDENRIPYRTSEDTAGFIIRIDVAE